MKCEDDCIIPHQPFFIMNCLCKYMCVFFFLRHLFASMLHYYGVILHALLVIYILFSIYFIYILEP